MKKANRQKFETHWNKEKKESKGEQAALIAIFDPVRSDRRYRTHVECMQHQRWNDAALLTSQIEKAENRKSLPRWADIRWFELSTFSLDVVNYEPLFTWAHKQLSAPDLSHVFTQQITASARSADGAKGHFPGPRIFKRSLMDHDQQNKVRVQQEFPPLGYWVQS